MNKIAYEDLLGLLAVKMPGLRPEPCNPCVANAVRHVAQCAPETRSHATDCPARKPSPACGLEIEFSDMDMPLACRGSRPEYVPLADFASATCSQPHPIQNIRTLDEQRYAPCASHKIGYTTKCPHICDEAPPLPAPPPPPPSSPEPQCEKKQPPPMPTKAVIPACTKPWGLTQQSPMWDSHHSRMSNSQRKSTLENQNNSDSSLRLKYMSKLFDLKNRCEYETFLKTNDAKRSVYNNPKRFNKYPSFESSASENQQQSQSPGIEMENVHYYNHKEGRWMNSNSEPEKETNKVSKPNCSKQQCRRSMQTHYDMSKNRWKSGERTGTEQKVKTENECSELTRHNTANQEDNQRTLKTCHDEARFCAASTTKTEEELECIDSDSMNKQNFFQTGRHHDTVKCNTPCSQQTGMISSHLDTPYCGEHNSSMNFDRQLNAYSQPRGKLSYFDGPSTSREAYEGDYDYRQSSKRGVSISEVKDSQCSESSYDAGIKATENRGCLDLLNCHDIQNCQEIQQPLRSGTGCSHFQKSSSRNRLNAGNHSCDTAPNVGDWSLPYLMMQTEQTVRNSDQFDSRSDRNGTYSPGSPSMSSKNCNQVQFNCNQVERNLQVDQMVQQNKSELKLRQIEHLVKDNYFPGLIQDTVNGRENFNTVSHNLMYGEGKEPRDDKTPMEPLSLLEAFQMRINLERTYINEQSGGDRANPSKQGPNVKDIESHFAKRYDTELNKAIASLLTAEVVHAKTFPPKPPKKPKFNLKVNKVETAVPGSNSGNIAVYTGNTEPRHEE